MELDCTKLVVLKATQIYIWKTQQQCLFPEIMTWLLKIIHRLYCEQLYDHHFSSESPRIDGRPVLLKAQDAIIIGVLFSWAAMLMSKVC